MGETDRGQLVKAGDQTLVRTDEGMPAGAVVPAPDLDGGDAEIARLRAEIETTRLRIRSSLEHLHEEVDEKLDWQGYVREHPWQVVGVAFAVGFFFGTG